MAHMGRRRDAQPYPADRRSGFAEAIWSQGWRRWAERIATSVILGGIQSGPVVAMHQRKDLAEYTSAEGVYFAAHVDTLKQLVRDSNTPCRIFIGQAVWAQGQLEQQFSQGCWLPLEVNSRVAFETPDRMWVAALRQAGTV